MSTVNYVNPNQDQNITIFDNFYNFQLTVDANLYDAVYSYFASIFSEELAAKNFTLNLFQISETSGTAVLDLLEEVKGQDAISLTATFAYYLNNLRSNSTLLGVGATVTPSVFAARNIVV
jgi:hypothetical protein